MPRPRWSDERLAVIGDEGFGFGWRRLWWLAACLLTLRFSGRASRAAERSR